MLSDTARQRLQSDANLWLATVRADGRPHLVPIWFVFHAERLYICTMPDSVKSRNLRQNPNVTVALENGNSPVIAEGTAALVPPPWPDEINAAFQSKYDWYLNQDTDYRALFEITPRKWLTW
ncbi:pyridoxamine 5'-phosphate oxidase family protein [Candidatus Amarolinea aalborgensis]|uniref:pyridoxamine 5'-phosphate oxidase family protein n=1 Tax=Candidatus Amarolinea aalborgensis TaxID=2249329 RepID=UPI003BF977B3